MLLQIASFHFLWLSNIPFYLCTTFSLSIPPADGHLDYFLLAAVIGAHVFFQIVVFSECMPLEGEYWIIW